MCSHSVPTGASRRFCATPDGVLIARETRAGYHGAGHMAELQGNPVSTPSAPVDVGMTCITRPYVNASIRLSSEGWCLLPV